MAEFIVRGDKRYEIVSKHKWAGIAHKMAKKEPGLSVTSDRNLYLVIREVSFPEAPETPDYMLR